MYGYYWDVSYSEKEMTQNQGLTTNIRVVVDPRTAGIFVRDTAFLHCDLMNMTHNENMPYLVCKCLPYRSATLQLIAQYPLLNTYCSNG